MPLFGNTQPQTLAYRVEIDQSSLSEAVQNIQASVGQAMSSAMASVQGLAQGGQAAVATAMGSSAAGNLSFMEGMRARILTQPTAAGTTPSVMQVIMAVPGAVAAKAGYVDPGFSQTQSGMMDAATKTLRDARLTAGELFSKGMHGLGTLADWTGTAAGVIGTGAGWMGATGVAAAMGPIGWAAAGIGGAISLGMIGVDRMNETEALRRSMMRFGDGPARAMVREVEESSRSMRGVGFEEASQVARSALMNVGPQTLSAAGASSVIRESIQDWRMIGKLWGVDKDAALEIQGQAYRMGMTPGGVTGLMTNVRTGADALGVSSTALGERSFQFGQASMGLGYDALASANQFTIQAAAVGEAARSGTVSRSQMALMAGFAGPIADQGVAISQMQTASLRALQTSDFGRLAQMGMMRGGTGGFGNLVGTASGASLEEMIGFQARQMRTMTGTADMQRLQEVQTGAVEDRLRSLGVKMSHDTFVGMSRSMFGQTAGEAEAFWLDREQPWNRERTRVRGMVTEAEARLETRIPAAGIAQWWEGYKEKAGAAYNWMWSGNLDRKRFQVGWGADSEYWRTGAAQDALSDVNDGRNLFGGEEELNGPRRGIRGIGRSLYSTAGATFGRLWDNVWNSWEVAPGDTGTWGFRRTRGGVAGRGTARAQFLRQADVKRATDIELAQGGERAAVVASAAVEEWGEFVGGDRTAAINRSRQEIMSRAWNEADEGTRDEIRQFEEQIGTATGMSFSRTDTLGLISNSILLRRDIGGKTGADREAVIKRGMEDLRREDKYKDVGDVQLRQLVEAQVRFSGTNRLLSDADQLKLEAGMTAEARNQAFSTVMESDDAWSAFAAKVFKDPNSAIALEIRKRGKAGTINEQGLRQMLGGAAVRGELTRGMTGAAAQREFLMAGAQGETEGVSRTDLPTTGKAGADIDAQIAALVKSTGSLVDAIKTLVEREKNK